VHTPPEKQDITMGNLLLAEDRVLCWSAALKTRERRYTAIVPRSVFYFAGMPLYYIENLEKKALPETNSLSPLRTIVAGNNKQTKAETQLKTLAFQRRRWINGTVAGYLFLALQHPEIIFNSKHHLVTKWFLWLLIMCQLLMFAVVAVSPALFLITLELSLEIISEELNADSHLYALSIFVIALLCYLWFMIGHHMYSRFIALAFYMMMCLHAATVILSVAAVGITCTHSSFKS